MSIADDDKAYNKESDRAVSLIKMMRDAGKSALTPEEPYAVVADGIQKSMGPNPKGWRALTSGAAAGVGASLRKKGAEKHQVVEDYLQKNAIFAAEKANKIEAKKEEIGKVAPSFLALSQAANNPNTTQEDVNETARKMLPYLRQMSPEMAKDVVDMTLVKGQNIVVAKLEDGNVRGIDIAEIVGKDAVQMLNESNALHTAQSIQKQNADTSRMSAISQEGRRDTLNDVSNQNLDLKKKKLRQDALKSLTKTRNDLRTEEEKIIKGENASNKLIAIAEERPHIFGNVFYNAFTNPSEVGSPTFAQAFMKTLKNEDDIDAAQKAIKYLGELDVSAIGELGSAGKAVFAEQKGVSANVRMSMSAKNLAGILKERIIENRAKLARAKMHYQDLREDFSIDPDGFAETMAQDRDIVPMQTSGQLPAEYKGLVGQNVMLTDPSDGKSASFQNISEDDLMNAIKDGLKVSR